MPIIDDDKFENEEYFWVECSPMTPGVIMPFKKTKIIIAGPNDGMLIL